MRVQTFHDLQGVEVSLPTCINVEDLLGIPDQSVKVHRENNLKKEGGGGKRGGESSKTGSIGVSLTCIYFPSPCYCPWGKWPSSFHDHPSAAATLPPARLEPL